MNTIFKSVIGAALVLGATQWVAPAHAQEVNYNLPSAAQIEELKQNRQNKAVAERVGRRIMAAFELYEADDLNGAIAELAEAEPRDEFDIAYVNRFLGAFYAADEQGAKALDLLTKAVEADVLGWTDQAAAMKLLADLNLQEENYQNAIKYYGRWLQFTGEANPDVFLRIANAYYELKQFDKIIQPADLALRAYDEPNKNPYVLKVASYYEREMFAEAIEVLEAGLNQIPTEKIWWVQLANFYMIEEQIAKGLQTIEIAYLAGYLSSENHYRILIQLYGNSEIPYKSAMLMARHFEAGDVEKTELNARSAATSYEAAREFYSAAKWYGIAAELSDSAADRAKNLQRQGTALLRAERFEEAAVVYNKALDAGLEQDDEGKVYMSLAEAHLYSNKYQDAITAARKASEYEDQRRGARSWIGYIQNVAQRRGVSL